MFFKLFIGGKMSEETKISKIQISCLHIEMAFSSRKYAFSNIYEIFMKENLECNCRSKLYKFYKVGFIQMSISKT